MRACVRPRALGVIGFLLLGVGESSGKQTQEERPHVVAASTRHQADEDKES